MAGKKTHPKVYDAINNQLLALIDKGEVPWRATWDRESGRPRNIWGTPYRGVNVSVLTITALVNGYSSPYWITPKEALRRGGSFKGEKTTIVLRWVPKSFTKEEENEDGEVETRTIHYGYWLYYRVLNTDQVEGVDAPRKASDLGKEDDFEPLEAAEAIVVGYPNPPAIHVNGQPPSYFPRSDKVYIPQPEKFESPAYYYTTLFHELGHSTGHESRLSRFNGDVDETQFGSNSYSFEELVAEFTASYLASHAGIEREVLENNAAYLRGWHDRLKDKLHDDRSFLVDAATKAAAAADHILGVTYDKAKA